MGCVFSVIGKNFDVDAFLEEAKFRGATRRYKGAPRFRSEPEGKKRTHSFFSVYACKAGFHEPKKQIAGAIRFLKRNYDKLVLLKSTKGVDFATLDFGIELRMYSASGNGFCQSDFFPPALIKLAGELEIGIEISIYAPDSE
ncbi:MAG: hypothetical protein EOP52_04335 [Sphingobacteriales bacterium]|nr:MAG: hypothetical protein EOP52_04335 [Sphingobacteriales bacterium]